MASLITNSYLMFVNSRRYAVGFYLSAGMVLAIAATFLDGVGVQYKVLVIGGVLLLLPLNCFLYGVVTLLRKTDRVRIKNSGTGAPEVSDDAAVAIAEHGRTAELVERHLKSAVESSGELGYLAAIDFGSSKTRVFVAEITEGGICYRGHGIAESSGSNKGVVNDLDKAAASIQRAVLAAEDMSGVAIKSAAVGIGGMHVRGVNSRGGISLGTGRHQIGIEEIRQAVKHALIAIPAGHEILHMLPQEFIVDDQPVLLDPLGMMAKVLEVRLHIVTAPSALKRDVVLAVNKAGVHVEDTVFWPLACSDSVLRPGERELGVCLVNLGASSSDFIVFQDGAVVQTDALPIGGNDFTSDISLCLGISPSEAEQIKRQYGGAIASTAMIDRPIEAFGEGRSKKPVTARLLNEIVEPRACELFEMLRANLRKGVGPGGGVASVVLTGGSSQLAGIIDVAKRALGLPVRMGEPEGLARVSADVSLPEYSAVLGLILYAARVRHARTLQSSRLAELAPLWSARFESS